MNEHPGTFSVGSEEVEERFEEKMHELESKERERLSKTLADQLGYGYVNLRGFPIGPETLSLVTREEAETLQVIALYRSSGEVRLGCVDPRKEAVQAFAGSLGERLKARVDLYVISPNSFAWALKLYDHLPKLPVRHEGDIELSQETLQRLQRELSSIKEISEKLGSLSTTEGIALILAGALKAGASDIHLEAEQHDMKLRYRIDGVLQTVAQADKERSPKFVNRLKLLAGLKINVSDEPQDGRLTIHAGEENVDVRVSTLPSAYGESVVMRLLMSSAVGLGLDQLGLRGKAFSVLQAQLQRPNGMTITTGPTSSGKTTTLYAFLNQLNTPERKIVTLEDPVEYRLEGVNQSQIDLAKDYTFSKGLKAILRQNPDIVMVGEIRDAETADIAVHAALTGHLVLSSLHTNDAAGAVPRFLAMGVKPYLLAPALNAVIAQRLVRRICEHCKEEAQLPPEVLERVRASLSKIPAASGENVDLTHTTFFRGRGCDACNHIGLKGRIGVFEVLVMSPEIEKIVQSEFVAESSIQEVAVQHGMVTMEQDGLLKALDGITTVDEVFRVAAER